jgi:hypothetical protein
MSIDEPQVLWQECLSELNERAILRTKEDEFAHEERSHNVSYQLAAAVFRGEISTEDAFWGYEKEMGLSGTSQETQ